MNNKKFIITIIILAVIVAIVSFFAVNEARKNKEMSQLFAVENKRWKMNTAHLLPNTTNCRFR